MKIKPEIQSRCIELRNQTSNESDNQMRISGVAVVFESPTVLYEYNGVKYKEIIDRKALNNADFSKCCLKYNHTDIVPVLARTRNGSLKTSIKDHGLEFEAQLFNTTAGKDVYTLIKEGGLDKCSFAFTTKRSEYDVKTHTRKILEIDKVFDISIVDNPAYDDTSVEARSFFELQNQKEKQALENVVRKRKLLLIATY